MADDAEEGRSPPNSLLNARHEHPEKSPDTKMKTRELFPYLLIAGLSCVLAAIGVTERADNVTHRVIQGVALIPWEQIFFPFDHAAVVEAQGIRPISLLLVKLYASLFGPLSSPPTWLYVLKGGFSFMAFGMASHACLTALGFRREALLATVGALILSPNLFMAWQFPEFDNLGAAATLYATAQLVRSDPPGRRRWAATILALAFAFLLKESTALIQFAFLGSLLWILHLTKQREAFWRVFKVTLVGVLAWGALVSPLLSGDTSGDFASQSLEKRLMYVLHNSDQLVFLASLYGPPLLIPLALNRPWTAFIPGAWILLLSALPLLSVYSHYETYYFSPPYLVSALGLILLLSTGNLARRASTHAGLAMIGACVWLTLLGFGAVQILAPGSREDLSTRLFYALTPLLYGAILMGARRAWQLSHMTWTPAWGRLARFGVICAVLSFVWFNLSSALNFTSKWHPFHELEHAAKTELSRQPLADTKVLFNHFIQFLGSEELRALGAQDINGETTFLIVPDWLRKERFPTLYWPEKIGVNAHIAAGKTIPLYWFAGRSRMDATSNEILVGDFSWSRSHAGGFFQPPAYIDHNHPEDMRFTTYRSGTSPLERLAATHGKRLWAASVNYWTVAPFLPEFPRRLLSGLPLLETYRYEARLHRLTKP